MMEREELKRYLGRTGYTLGHVEKDYFQHMILGGISRDIGDLMVFKGGTALQKTGISSRFSEDLDFTLVSALNPEKAQKTAMKTLEDYGYDADIDNLRDDELTLAFRMKIVGPLYRNRRGVCSIRLEASRREEVLLEPNHMRLDPVYPDILSYVINIMHPQEMLAEKTRALYVRDKPRDLYDLMMLAKTGCEADRELIDRKLSYYGLEYDKKTLVARCERLAARWDIEMEGLTKHVPEFSEAMGALRQLVDSDE